MSAFPSVVPSSTPRLKRRGSSKSFFFFFFFKQFKEIIPDLEPQLNRGLPSPPLPHVFWDQLFWPLELFLFAIWSECAEGFLRRRQLSESMMLCCALLCYAILYYAILC